MRAVVIQLGLLVLLSSSIAIGEHSPEGSGTVPLMMPDPPDGEWYVHDMAGVISEQTEAEYESELSRIKDESGVLVRLVTVSSMMEASNGVCMGFGCWDSEYFSEDNGFARQMFRHFGMEGGDQPSMLIALSTEDRQFKFVMPGLSETTQRFSQGVFEDGSYRLSEAADAYRSDSYIDMWDGWERYPGECVWEGAGAEWVNNSWHCYMETDMDGYPYWDIIWYLCESHNDNWWCTDQYGQDPAHGDSENGSLMTPPPEPEGHDYSRGNLWEEALSFYVYESGTLVSIESYPLSVHLAVYAIGALGLIALLLILGDNFLEVSRRREYNLARDRLTYAYARRRADLSLKSLKGGEDGTAFETIADQIESLSIELRKDPEESLGLLLSDEDEGFSIRINRDDDERDEYQEKTDRYNEKICAELNKRADDAGVPEQVTIPDMDMTWEIGILKEAGDRWDRVNRVAGPLGLAVLATGLYLGFGLNAGGPLSLGEWAFENPGYLFGYGGGFGTILMITAIFLFAAMVKGLMDSDELVRAVAPPRNPLLPIRRPSPTLRVADTHNMVVPASLAGAFVSSRYLVRSAGFDEHGNEIYETERSHSGGGGGSDGGGGGGGGGCGGGGCGGGGGF